MVVRVTASAGNGKKKTAKKASSKKKAAKKTTKKAATKKAAKKKAAKRTTKKAPAKKASAKKASKKSTARASSGATGQSRSSKKVDRVMENIKREFGRTRDAVSSELDRLVDATRRRIPKQQSVIDEAKLKSVREDFQQRMSSVRDRMKDARTKVSSASEKLKVEEKARAAADAGLHALHGLASGLRSLAEKLEEAAARRDPKA